MAFDVEGARKAGYTDAEIADHMAKTSGFDLAAAKKAGYTDPEVIAHLAKGPAVPAARSVDRIPGSAPGDVAPPATNAAPDTSNATLADKVIGTGEAALSTVSGMTGGALGMLGGTLKGLAEQILSGQFGTAQAANLVERSATQGAEALTYSPRTPSGQEQAAAVGQAMQGLIPVAPLLPTIPPVVTGARGTPAAVMARAGTEGVARDAASMVAAPAEAARLVAPGAAGDAAAAATAATTNAALKGAARVAGLAREATTLPRRALERITRADEAAPTAGTKGSAGSAGTDVAAQRLATADQLPVPMGRLMTKGDLTRDPAQQKFEAETAKLPDAGKPLRDRLVAKNQAILENFDAAIDQTGAQATTLRAVGDAVDKALVNKAAAAKTEIRARYKAAENAGEMEAPVSLQSVVDHLNESAPDAATAPLLTTARARAIQTGIAAEGPNGQLIAQPVPLKRAETFRQAIGAATDYTPTNVRQSTIIKGLVDEATSGMGGALYRRARAARARYAQEFENRAVISKLLNNKRGTADRQVALEDVFDHAIKKGSLDDVRTVRKVLQTAGENGQQAWRELQAATLRDIQDQMTRSAAPDSLGNRVVSPAALDRAIRALDEDGKLDFIFTKKGAQTLRDIREVAQLAKTVSPEAAVNHSNTAMTLAALADTVFSGMSGVPAPITTTTRLALGHIKDVRLRNRISDALNQVEKKAPGKRGQPPIREPKKTVH